MCNQNRNCDVRPKRLLFIHQNFVTPHQAGNCSRPAIGVGTLLSMGWSVDVITSQLGYLNDTNLQQNPKCIIEKEGALTIHRLRIESGGSHLWNRGRFYINFLLKALLYIRRFDEIDVILTSSPPILQIIPSILFSAWHRVPMVLELRDLWPARLIDNGLLTSSAAIVMGEWIEALMYHYTDHIIPIAPTYRPYLEFMGVPSECISVIPTGGSTVYSTKKDNLKIRWRKGLKLEHKFLLLYAGSFNEAYELKTIIDAAYEIASIEPDVHWIFAGNGRQLPMIEKAAHDLPTFHYLGCIPSTELLNVYMCVDAGVNTFVRNPQNEINIPGKLFDYLAAGLPVISLINGLSGAILSSSKAGVILKRCTTTDLIKAVLEYKHMPRRRLVQMGKSGQRWVLTYMNSIALWRNANNLFVDVTKRKGHAPGLMKCISSVIAATKDTLQKRGRKSIKELFTNRRQHIINKTYNDWLNDHRTRSPSCESIELPQLLTM